MSSRAEKILGTLLILMLVFVWNSCGSQPGCPTCGTTVKGAYGVIDVVPVPEHNPTGEPGGPFNSFDISTVDPIHHLDYVSDRIGLDVVVVNTLTDEAVATIGGLNEVAQAGNNGSPCDPTIPSLITGAGQVNPTRVGNGLTRFGCRNAPFFAAFSTAFPGFGANGNFGGFPGAQCCASRSNGVNPLSGPDGNVLTPDGGTLFVGTGSASVVVFDVTGKTNPPEVIADIYTGASPDFDGPNGVAACIASWNGGAGSDPTCGDDRADEMSYGTVGGRDILMVTNGDPGLPFVTLIDVTDIVNRNTAGPFTSPGQGRCLPVNYPAVSPTALTSAANNYTSANPPACILGQIYYDGSPVNDTTTAVDQTGAPCPDPSEAVPSGASGGPFLLVATGGTLTIPCHHSAIVNQNTGVFIPAVGGIQTAVAPVSGGEIGVAGLGGSVFNPFHNTFFLTNSNCTVSGVTVPPQSSVAVGCVDEIDPRIGNPHGPVVVNVIPVLNCMPAGIVEGPAHDFLVGCGDHDGIAFPPNVIIIDGTTDTIVATITQTGAVDEVWYNPGDNRYYLAARDYPPGPQLGVIDAGTRQWLVNFPTNSNSHSVSVDPFNNHVFVPSQAGAICITQSANGCILVIAQQ